LGRGLSALLDDGDARTPQGRPSAGDREIPIELIHRSSNQPRRAFDATDLDELAQSIREKGVLQAILVRPSVEQPGEYQIVAGERRWRAAQRAGLHTIPVRVREIDDLEALEIGLIENIQRSDLGPLEEARGYAAMIERFSRTQETIAAIVGKSRSHVANTLRLLRLPPSVLAQLEAGRLSSGHARTLIDNPAAEALAERIIARGLNVRQAEELVRERDKPEKKRGKKEKASRGAVDADTRALENDLSEILGLAVRILDKAGAGELRVSYQTLEQLDDLCRRLTRSGG
jgi:ParB family chromosome partitioning protein